MTDQQSFFRNSQSKHFILLFSVVTLLVTAAFSQTRQRTEHWQQRNDIFNMERDSIGPGGTVFLGNSIIEGFDLQRWFADSSLINRGIVGDHMDGLIQRLDNSAVALEPKKLFIMIGINDIGDKRDDDYLMTMYDTLLDTLIHELPDTEILIHSILPTSERWKNCPPKQIRRINRYLKKLARQRNVTFINLHPLFLKGRKYLNPDLSRDGLHLNEKGYAIWVKEIERYLE